MSKTADASQVLDDLSARLAEAGAERDALQQNLEVLLQRSSRQTDAVDEGFREACLKALRALLEFVEALNECDDDITQQKGWASISKYFFTSTNSNDARSCTESYAGRVTKLGEALRHVLQNAEIDLAAHRDPTRQLWEESTSALDGSAFLADNLNTLGLEISTVHTKISQEVKRREEIRGGNRSHESEWEEKLEEQYESARRMGGRKEVYKKMTKASAVVGVVAAPVVPVATALAGLVLAGALVLRAGNKWRRANLVGDIVDTEKELRLRREFGSELQRGLDEASAWRTEAATLQGKVQLIQSEAKSVQKHLLELWNTYQKRWEAWTEARTQLRESFTSAIRLESNSSANDALQLRKRCLDTVREIGDEIIKLVDGTGGDTYGGRNISPEAIRLWQTCLAKLRRAEAKFQM